MFDSLSLLRRYEKNINTAAVEKMMAGATEDFKPGPQPKPTEKNTCIGETAAVEKMRASGFEDFNPGLKPKQRENSQHTATTGVAEKEFRWKSPIQGLIR